MAEKTPQEMTTRELRKAIRQATARANITVAEYRESGKVVKSYNELIEVAQKTAGTKSRRGVIGLGLSYKRKAELVQQYEAIRRVEKVVGEKKIQQEKEYKGYTAFTKRFGYMSRPDYIAFTDMMNAIKSDLEGWGYEDFDGGIAQSYTDANDKGKRNFIRYLKEAKQRAAGKDTEAVIDSLKDVLSENGALQ